MKKYLYVILPLIILILASCQSKIGILNPVPGNEPAQTASASPTETDKANSPEITPEPTPTSEPSPTPKPTPKATPKPTPKPTPVPSATPRPVTVDYEGIVIPPEYQQLSYFYADYTDRYKIYKALNPDFDFEKVIVDVDIGLDNPFYSNVKVIKDPDRIDVLVNKYNKLPDNFVPELVQVPPALCTAGVAKQYLRKDCLEAFEKMAADAKNEGLNITAYGTYRSIKMQNDIWTRKVNSGRSIEDVDKLNARGGYSEHHTGLAIDVIKNDYTVEKTKEFKWFKENAHRYGFIIRYQKGKSDVTGYEYEPWHLRYLGEELAAKVYESGLTFEEYYAKVIGPEIN